MTSGAMATVYGATHVTTFTLAMVRAWLVTAMVAAFSSPPAQAQVPAVDPATGPRLNREIVDAVEMYRRAALAGDARAVADLYTEDAVELPASEPLVRGRVAIEQRYRKFFEGSVKRTAFTFTHLEAMIEGNMGYAVGTFEQRLALPSGKTVTDTGKYVVILRRTQGAWKATYAIYNGDTPPRSSAAHEWPRGEAVRSAGRASQRKGSMCVCVGSSEGTSTGSSASPSTISFSCC